MIAMRRDPRIATIWALVLMSLTLVACGIQPETLPAPEDAMPLSTPVLINDQATVVALTQEMANFDNQSAATAEIMRANAQATINSANATLSVAQTQEQNNANVIAAQIAATVAIERANAQATLDSAGATQSAALTQDAIRQTQTADLATTNAQALLNQQNKDELAAGTQTAIANNIATQTQAAAATSQWYTDQSRQREEQRQGPIAFLWAWCLPTFVVLFAGLILWGFWRYLRIRQDNQRILENPVNKLPAPEDEIIDTQHDVALPYLENEIIDDRYQLTKPDDQVGRWVDEIKRKLLSSDEKDKDDNTDN